MPSKDFELEAYRNKADQLRGGPPEKALKVPTAHLADLADAAKVNDLATTNARKNAKARPHKPLTITAEYLVYLVDRAAKLKAPKDPPKNPPAK